MSRQIHVRKARETTNSVCRAFGVKPELSFENKGRSIQYNEWQGDYISKLVEKEKQRKEKAAKKNKRKL